jgi:lysozyme family protein
MMTPEQFAEAFILRWEDGNSNDPVKTHSLDRDDSGNWTGAEIGKGALVGSQHGVTPAALAAFRKVPVSQITLPVMRALSRNEAARIALRDYYEKPRLNLLPWNIVTASLFDFGWGAGPVTGIKKLQDMVDAPIQDGIVTPGGKTIQLFTAFVKSQPVEFAAGAFWSIRERFYEDVIKAKPVKAKYERGWDNRSRWYTPGGEEGFWARFHA